MEDLKINEATSIGSSDRWYALRCKSNMEFIVKDQLHAKLIPYYLPVYAVKTGQPAFPHDQTLFSGLSLRKRRT